MNRLNFYVGLTKRKTHAAYGPACSWSQRDFWEDDHLFNWKYYEMCQFRVQNQAQEFGDSNIRDREQTCPLSVLHGSQSTVHARVTVDICLVIPCNPMNTTVPATGMKFKGRYIT